MEAVPERGSQPAWPAMTHGMSYQVELEPPRHAGPRHSASRSPAELMVLLQVGAQRMVWEGESSA